MKRLIFTAIIFLIYANFATAVEDAKLKTEIGKRFKPRIALLSVGDKEAESIVDLMETELSSRDDIVLLERRDVRKILTEHSISLEGFLSGKEALKIGKLLKCDILAEINYEKPTANTGSMVSIVAFDTLTGIRFCDKSIPPVKDLDKCAESAAKSLYQSLEKWKETKNTQVLRTLSFVSSRHADVPGNLAHIPRTIRILLERRMLNLSDVAVLERKRLKSVLNESGLTGLQLDRLMRSFVLVDIDISKGIKPETLVVKLLLTDGKGKSLGKIKAVGSVKNISELVTSLIGELAGKLKLVKADDIPADHMFEAERFLSEAFRYELRGYKKEALMSEASARALTESTLENNPDNIHAQKILCRLLIREFKRQNHSYHKSALLRRCLGMAVNWQQDNETPIFVQTFGELIHNLTKMFYKDKRSKIADLRENFGKWARKMDKQNTHCVNNIRIIEAWSIKPGSFVEGCGECLTHFPSGLGTGRYTATEDFGTEPDNSYLYQISDFSSLDKEKLLALYDKWGKSGSGRINYYRRMQSHICAAMLANSFRTEFKNHDKLVRHHISEALKLINEDPTLADLFLPLCFARGNSPPEFYSELPDHIIADEVLEIVNKLDEAKISTPLLFVYLDQFASDKAEFPGAFLKKAWVQLESPDYLEPSGDILKPEYIEWYMEHIKTIYRRRYGGDVTGDKVAELRDANLKTVKRIFDFESIPGISSIESAEIKGDWLYLLCLHSDPKMYELRRKNIKTGKVEIIGEMGADFNYRARTGNEIHIGENNVYVPTDKGLICCEIDTGKTWRISEEQGLPAPIVTACLELDDNIFMGVRGKEEGYLVKCSLKGDNIKVLANSGRKEKRSGLDDCPPYVIESMISYEEPTGFFDLFGLFGTDKEILFSAMFLEPDSSNQPWLWRLDPDNDTIKPAHNTPYHTVQLRKLSENRLLFQLADLRFKRRIKRKLTNGKEVSITLREPSQRGPRGYGIFDISSINEDSTADLKDHAAALIGSTDPEKLRIRYNTPNFCGRKHIIPNISSSLCLLNDFYLVASDVRKTPVVFPMPKERYMQQDQAGYQRTWQIIPRNDTGDIAMQMPLLDDEAPFLVRTYKRDIIACTQGGVWRIEPSLPEKDDIITRRKNSSQKKRSPEKKKSYGRLIVNCPDGALVTLDKNHSFYTWKESKLYWNKLAPGKHQIDIQFFDKSVSRNVTIQPEKITTVEEWFDKDKIKTRSLDLGNGVSMEFVWVPFNNEKWYRDHKISFGDGFWIGRYEVTQEQYESLIKDNPSIYRDKLNPVSNISRNDAAKFCSVLMKKCSTQLNGLVARLPSDHEWKYACMAGSKQAFSVGDTREDLMRTGWVKENSNNHAHQVGKKMPNRFRLYDMQGNVGEWGEWGNPFGQSWVSDTKSPRHATGMRVVLTPPDSELGIDKEGWRYLIYTKPRHARIGWGTFRRYKKRDNKPPVGYSNFHTVMYCHANSSIKYKLDGKYTELQANFGLWTGAHGVCRFAVVADGKQIFKSGHIYGFQGNARTGTGKPIKLDITGVDILELKTVQAEGKSLANACGMWADVKVK